jgi:hypothetical protein
MFREMRRNRQLLPEEESIAILENGTSGVLALSGDSGYPYAVPMSYVYNDRKLYFHSALNGHKIDAIRRNELASFCVIAQDVVVPAEFTTRFRSVIAFGRIRIIDEPVEKRRTAELLAAKYDPDNLGNLDREMEKGFDRMCMIELEIEHLTGKEAIELARKK